MKRSETRNQKFDFIMIVISYQTFRDNFIVAKHFFPQSWYLKFRMVIIL